MNRKLMLASFALASLMEATGQVQAQTWGPQRPLRIIAGAPGAILDVAARQVAEKIASPLGQPVLIENRAGAGGVVTMEAAARSAPDGHTMAIATFVELTVNPWLYERLPYDPVRDFAPVTVLYNGPQLLVANLGAAPRTLADIVQAVKKNTGRLSYGSSGIARPPHIFMEKFKLVAGIDLLHVAYRGGPPLLQAVLAGEVPLAMEGTSATVPLVQSGKLRAIAVTGDRRLAALPEVPTFGEAGIPGIGLAWVGIVMPAGAPAGAVTRLQREIAAALQSPDLRAAYEMAGRTPVGNAPDDFAALIRRDLAEWRDVVRRSGIKPE